MVASDLTLPPRLDGFPVILYGLECQTTAIVLGELLRAGIDIRLVCLPGRSSIPVLPTRSRTSLPMATSHSSPNTVAGLARSSGLNLWRLGDLRSHETMDALRRQPADLVVVACYNQLLPVEIYADRAYGGLNIHPSLLPDKRGPDPLFWVFKEDDQVVGTTVHRLTDEFDAGDVLAQESFPKPDGITERELDARLSDLGARLLLETIQQLRAGTLRSRPQSDETASWAPYPSPPDFVLDRSTSARAAFNFVRGVGGRSHPVLIDLDGRQLRVTAVHRWHTAANPPGEQLQRATAIEFADGWLVATVVDEPA